jgi:hypothetical protein
MTRILTSENYQRHVSPPKLRKFNLSQALRHVTIEGKYLEFGVWTGFTINFIASKICQEQIVYGFDCWQGLPEEWITPEKIHPQGSYSTNNVLPEVAINVRLVSGLFEDTLPKFVLDHPEPTAFVHIDSDLYSSAKTIFTHIGSSLVKGSIIVFDEWFNNPGHEDRAFEEFLEEKNKTATAIIATSHQLTVSIN